MRVIGRFRSASLLAFGFFALAPGSGESAALEGREEARAGGRVETAEAKEMAVASRERRRIAFEPARQLLLRKNVPFAPEILLETDWKARLSLFVNAMQEFQTSESLENRVGGAHIAGAIRVNGVLELDDDLVLLAKRIVFDSASPVIRGPGRSVFIYAIEGFEHSDVRYPPGTFARFEVTTRGDGDTDRNSGASGYPGALGMPGDSPQQEPQAQRDGTCFANRNGEPGDDGSVGGPGGPGGTGGPGGKGEPGGNIELSLDCDVSGLIVLDTRGGEGGIGGLGGQGGLGGNGAKGGNGGNGASCGCPPRPGNGGRGGKGGRAGRGGWGGNGGRGGDGGPGGDIVVHRMIRKTLSIISYPHGGRPGIPGTGGSAGLDGLGGTGGAGGIKGVSGCGSGADGATGNFGDAADGGKFPGANGEQGSRGADGNYQSLDETYVCSPSPDPCVQEPKNGDAARDRP
jgi:hypothetical protein